MIAEAPQPDSADDFYAGNGAFYFKTTAQAFAEAGLKVASMQDILDLVVYLTTAIKCARVGYTVYQQTIQTCSSLLAREMALFPNVASTVAAGHPLAAEADGGCPVWCHISRFDSAAG